MLNLWCTSLWEFHDSPLIDILGRSPLNDHNLLAKHVDGKAHNFMSHKVFLGITIISIPIDHFYWMRGKSMCYSNKHMSYIWMRVFQTKYYKESSLIEFQIRHSGCFYLLAIVWNWIIIFDIWRNNKKHQIVMFD